MEVEIIEVSDFELMGVSIPVSTKDGEQLSAIPAFWGKCEADGTVAQAVQLGLGPLFSSGTLFGVCTDFTADMGAFTYLICCEKTTASAPPDGWVTLSLSTSTWAVFRTTGQLPDSIQATWKRIWPEFFDVSDYLQADAPAIEVYPPGDTMSAHYTCEVRVPVVRK